MKPVCEIVVKDVLPATRAMVAAKLAEGGLSGKEIAERMDLTPSAVTQYLHKARGSRALSNEVVEAEIDKFAKALLKGELGEKERMLGFCGLCMTVREQGLICELHGNGECDLCRRA